MTQTLTRSCTFTFDQLQESKYLFDRINTLCGLSEYKLNGRGYFFTNGTNCWRFDGFVTDAQWKTLAQLCIRFNADIATAIRSFTFETEYVSIVDADNRTDYEIPTSMRGFIGNTYFLIEEDGRANS